MKRKGRPVAYRAFDPVPARESRALLLVVTARNQREILLDEALCQSPAHRAKTDETQRET